jgi:hypothetical protein
MSINGNYRSFHHLSDRCGNATDLFLLTLKH